MKKFELNVVNFNNEDVIATSDTVYTVGAATGHDHVIFTKESGKDLVLGERGSLKIDTNGDYTGTTGFTVYSYGPCPRGGRDGDGFTRWTNGTPTAGKYKYDEEADVFTLIK